MDVDKELKHAIQILVQRQRPIVFGQAVMMYAT